MFKLKQALLAFWKDEKGLTTVEYAIAGGLVGATVIVAFTDLGAEVGRVINYIVTELSTAP
jgi:pilus assembly protein Flp/PilA